VSEVHLNEITALNFWRQATEQELGIKIPIKQADIAKIKELMYRVRKEAEDPSLEDIALLVAPGGTEVWLMKKTTELP
jgi:hypothetical protein